MKRRLIPLFNDKNDRAAGFLPHRQAHHRAQLSQWSGCPGL